MLDEQNRTTYQREGWVTPAWRLSGAILAAVRQAVDALIAANPEHRPEQIVCPHIVGGADGSLARDEALATVFLDLCRHPEIVAMVADLIGDDVILWGSQLFCKPAGDGMAIPWHQDGHYWPIRPLAACSVWIAIDKSSRENGCMQVIPGSHLGGLIAHESDDDPSLALNRAIPDTAIEQGAAVDIALEPGQVSLHDVNIVHGSAPNVSAKRRAAMVLRYMPATSAFVRDVDDQVMTNGARIHFADRPIWLVHGENRNHENKMLRH
jgi:ectoine hydroxylase-related dioxygenase (phytanoyl-CoA dioxygenase family)